MGVMKRKAIQLASNTLVVSLPAKWVKHNGIIKGTDLDVDVKESMLVIGKNADSIGVERRVSVDISGMNESLVWNFLNAIYRTGCTEIEIFFSDCELRNIKTNVVSKTMDTISRITDKLIGMEIISQSKNSCMLKEVTQMKGDEFNNVLNRIFLSLRTISGDVLDAVKTQDRETLINLYRYSEINVNKLSDYCMRILNLQGLKGFRDSNLNYLMVFLLEEVGDVYAQIARGLSSNSKIFFAPETIGFFEKTNRLLELSHKIMLNPTKEYYIAFHEQRNSIKSGLDALADSKKKVDLEVLFFLKTLLDKLMELNNAKVSASGGL